MRTRPVHSDLRGHPFGYWSTGAAVLAFGVAMGWLEAVVVVYLRAAIEFGGSAVVAAHDPATLGTYEHVEIARELGTLIMIGAVGWLAGRTGFERLAWTAVAFGTWDIVYYLGLRLVIGWPPALDTLDVLFLAPTPWVAPVWAPVVVSGALIGFGLAGARRLRTGGSLAVGPVQVLGALFGGALVVFSFLVDGIRLVTEEAGTWMGWPVFAAGMTLAVAGAGSALRAGRSTRDAGPPAPGELQPAIAKPGSVDAPVRTHPRAGGDADAQRRGR